MTSPFKIYAATRSDINHPHAQWAQAMRTIHHEGDVVVGGALAGGDSAPAAASKERWRCIISSATCGRRLLEQDHPAAPGHNIVNLMVGRQGRLGRHCCAKITEKSSVFLHCWFFPHHVISTWFLFSHISASHVS